MSYPHIKQLKHVITASGRGMFLVVGISGCTSNDECKDLKYAPQFKVDECKEKSSGHSGSSTFMPTTIKLKSLEDNMYRLERLISQQDERLRAVERKVK